MLAVGRAILSNPKLLILDEPMLGVAPVLRKMFSYALDKLKKKNISVLVTEQELFLTIKNTEKIYIIQDGLITHSRTKEEYLSDKKLGALYFTNKSHR